MKTRPAYIVIDTNGRQPTIVRSRQSWPALDPGEIVVRLSLEIPDELIPQVQEFTIEDLEAMVAVAPEVVEVPA